jgi:hypothetical protein
MNEIATTLSSGHDPSGHDPSGLAIDLAAAIVTVANGAPQILMASGPAQETPRLPAGPFNPTTHRTFEAGLRTWVTEQAGIELGYVEQLYTFGDRGRLVQEGALHIVSVGYLALTRGMGRVAPAMSLPALGDHPPRMLPWYRFFPWEDWRGGTPPVLERSILPLLANWAADSMGEAADPHERALTRRQRMAFCFGADGAPWDEEKSLERYELLYDAGLIAEARRDGRAAALAQPSLPPLGEMMQFDHRRILATAIGRLRAKLKYRPVVFEMMPGSFTLTELQQTVEAISGRHLHKQNFRRLVEDGGLVEPTGTTSKTAGRPAALFRFRRDVLAERPAPGLRLGGRG